MATGRVPTTANSPLTAKGDLFGYSTTQARVAVGSDGDTLVADSATSTGLRWQGNYSAGKNKIINGDFGIWQRGTSFSNPKGVYTADRYAFNYDGTGNLTISQQTFTPGTAPVAGYEGQYYMRLNQTTAGSGTTFSVLQQPIEDVRTFAGQTVTISFWAKADAARTLGIALRQEFGSGGSSVVDTSGAGASLTTSWARYTNTITVPSVSGKTIGTGSSLRLFIQLPLNTTQTIELWGVQVEAGSVATAFQTATGTLQGELAACQRYFYNVNFQNTTRSAYNTIGNGFNSTTTNARIFINLPVSMRQAPSALTYSGTFVIDDGVTGFTPTNITINQSGANVVFIDLTSSSLTQYRPVQVYANNDANARLSLSAEL
jgi:hypothetical protein